MWKAPGRLYFKRVTKKSLDSYELNVAYMRLTEHPTDKQSYSRVSTKLNIWWSITWNRLRLFLLWSAMQTGCLPFPARPISGTYRGPGCVPDCFTLKHRSVKFAKKFSIVFMSGNEPEKKECFKLTSTDDDAWPLFRSIATTCKRHADYITRIICFQLKHHQPYFISCSICPLFTFYVRLRNLMMFQIHHEKGLISGRQSGEHTRWKYSRARDKKAIAKFR